MTSSLASQPPAALLPSNAVSGRQWWPGCKRLPRNPKVSVEDLWEDHGNIWKNTMDTNIYANLWLSLGRVSLWWPTSMRDLLDIIGIQFLDIHETILMGTLWCHQKWLENTRTKFGKWFFFAGKSSSFTCYRISRNSISEVGINENQKKW